MHDQTTEALALLLAAVRPFLALKELEGRLLGEPEDSPAYHKLVEAMDNAEVIVGELTSDLPSLDSYRPIRV